MLFARHGDIKQTRRQNMAEIVFSWGVSEIKYIIFIENSDYPYENYNNYIKLSIVFHPMVIFFRKYGYLISAMYISYFLHNQQFTWGDEWSFSCKILYLHKFFLPITTPKSNPSKHYKHFRKAVAFAFRKLELCRHCRFRAGSFSGLSSRIQVLAHMPC